MIRDDNILTLVQVLSETLPKDILDYFENAKNEELFITKLEQYMGAWYKEHKDSISFEDVKPLVWYTIENSMELSVNAEQAYAKYVDNRRSSKKNWLNKIKKEYEQIKAGEPASGFLTLDADSYFSLKNMNGPVSDKYDSREEYIENRYEELCKWQKDKETSLINFIYFRELQPIQRVKAFMIEVGLYTFDNIMTQMYGNLEGGLFTSVPDSVFKNAFFSTQQNAYDQISFTFEDGVGTFYNDYSSSEGDNIVRTAFKSVPMTEQEAHDNAIIQSLQNEFKLSDKAKSLDPVDFQILQTICSNLTASVLSGGTMTLSLKSLARQFYKKTSGIRSRDYLLLIRHINKLAEYTLSATRKNEDTKVVEKIILHFMDVHFQIPTSVQNQIRNIDKEIREVLDEKNDDLAGVSMDISETILQIIPGKTITDAWKEDTLQRVYSKTYAQIEDAKTKLFLTIMETERLRIHPKTSQTLDISFFTNRLQFNMAPNKIRSAIKDGLKSLMDTGIVVNNFDFIDKKSIKIDYVPINDTEKLVYKIEK